MAKILIIEDDAAIAAIEKDYLKLSGYEVNVCADGVSGLTAALEQPFDPLIRRLTVLSIMETSTIERTVFSGGIRMHEKVMQKNYAKAYKLLSILAVAPPLLAGR